MNGIRGILHLKELSCLRGHASFQSRNPLLTSNCLPVRSFRSTIRKRSRWPGSKSTNQNIKIEPPAESPFEGIFVERGPIVLNNLWKPIGFTLAFSGASFAGAAIWQYENMRSRAVALLNKPAGWVQDKFFPSSSRKNGTWRQEVNRWWNSLSEGEKLFVPICFANVLVFAAWRVPSLQPTMVRYFCSNPASRVQCWPMLLSTFSHYSAFHLFANMYVLHSFSTGAIAALGKEQFLGLYLSAGVVSSLASYMYKTVMHKPGLSLGASGAIMAVLGYVCMQYPDTKLSIIFMPFLTFTAGSAIKVIMGIDAAGILLGWKLFDHAAHLGGAMCGILWCYWGNTYIWQKREPLLHWWHEVRGTPVK